MRAILKIWTDAKSEVATERVITRAIEQVDRVPQNPMTEPYPKTGGYVYQCELDLECTGWESCVVEIIALGQQLCHAWTISGDVHQDVEGWSNQCQVVGVKTAQWILRRLE